MSGGEGVAEEFRDPPDDRVPSAGLSADGRRQLPVFTTPLRGEAKMSCGFTRKGAGDPRNGARFGDFNDRGRESPGARVGRRNF